jgi:hypothetical protein
MATPTPFSGYDAKAVSVGLTCDFWSCVVAALSDQ